ncbi:MAG TPA: type II secretion system protein [Blastocatellia bacterium]|nr:type II secretion system protein [Blastocatellia bacterium]
MIKVFMDVKGMQRFGTSLFGNRPLPTARRLPGARGFTLLELVMVMTIIVILAAIGITSYQNIRMKAQETILKENLRQLRKLLDQYGADKGKLPQSLDDLVPNYIREVPIDPITGEKDWQLEMGDDPYSLEGGQGVVDVRSNAAGEDSEGTPYSKL